MESSAPRPVFYFDLNSPYSYLAAERVGAVFSAAQAEQPEWQPIAYGFLIREIGKTPWSMGPDGPNPDDLREIQRRAAERGLPEVRYAEGWPVETYSLLAIRAATFAKQSARVVSFALAAFRQVFVAGRDLSQIDNVLLAAAACELHPKAVLKAIETESVKRDLKRATQGAMELGVTGIPTVAVGDELFWGDDRLEEAASAAAV